MRTVYIMKSGALYLARDCAQGGLRLTDNHLTAIRWPEPARAEQDKAACEATIGKPLEIRVLELA